MQLCEDAQSGGLPENMNRGWLKLEKYKLRVAVWLKKKNGREER